MAFDPVRVLRALVEHEVRFVVIGGLAGNLRGSPSVTNDLDICYERTPENHERLASALRELDATLRGAPGLPFHIEAKTIGAGDHSTFSTNAGPFDCLGTPSGSTGYDGLLPNATDFSLGGVTVLAASLDDLIRMKRAAGRPKDLIELEVLGALRDELEE